MSRAIMKSLLAVAVLLAVAAAAQAAITIDVVPVGNTDNIADTYTHSGNPAGQGAVSYPYNIGKYEVTAGQYAAFLNAVAGVDRYGLYSTGMSNRMDGCGIAQTGGGTVGNPYAYTVDPDFVNRPVNFVSWGDAARFANWLANGQPTGAQGLATTEDGSYYLNGATSREALTGVTRKTGATWFIPSEDEWYKAAYHKNDGNTANYFTYPTGSDTAPGRNMADPSGNNANYYTPPNISPIDSGKYTTLVGEFQNSPSPYGTFDQGGNVFEWNEANLYGPWPARRLLGGSFGDFLDYLASSSRSHYDPSSGNILIGFRVASVPEPGSIALLLSGAVAGLIWWRRRK